MNLHELIEGDNDARTLLNLFQRTQEECFQLSKTNNIHLPIRRLFIQSDGQFNMYVNRAIGNLRPASNRTGKSEEGNNRIFKRIQQQQIITQIFETGGYATNKISTEDLEEIKLSLDHADSDGDSKRQFITSWDRLKRHTLVKKLIAEKSIREICDAYLRCESILNMVVAWKTKPGINIEQLSSDAMMYHFDSDHNRFIKVFIYLGDVDQQTGPHSYAPRTSAKYRKNLPRELKRDGRLNDNLLNDYGITTQKVCGEKGTIIFADTHNLHKGTPVIGTKARYILQLQFTDSLLGAPSPHDFSEIIEMNNGMVEL